MNYRLLAEKISTIEKTILSPEPESSPWMFRLWQVFLYLGGVYLWAKFFDMAGKPPNFHDWYQVSIPRIDFIRQALVAGQWPLHAADDYLLYNVTDRFLAIPDVITTPQMVLLLFVSIPTFILLDVLIHYSIAFFSLMYLRSKYNLSVLVTTVVFLVFNFSGHILSHYSVGHFTWAGYFLFPLFFVLVFELMEKPPQWAWIAKMAFLLFYMVLAGSLHHYVWLLIFLGVLVLVRWRQAPQIIAAAFFSGTLAAIRLLPAGLEAANIEKKGAFNYVLGYPSIMELMQAMASLKRPHPVEQILFFQTDTVNSFYWEFNYYIGILGLTFVLFGLILWIRDRQPLYWQLLIPTLVIFALSMGSTYRILRMTSLPLLLSERVTSRMVSVAITFFIIIAAIYVQKWLNQRQFSPFQRVLMYASVILIGIEIFTSLKLWRISESAVYFGSLTVENYYSSLANYHDPQYELILTIGLILTLCTAIFLLYQCARERQQKQPPLSKNL